MDPAHLRGRWPDFCTRGDTITSPMEVTGRSTTIRRCISRVSWTSRPAWTRAPAWMGLPQFDGHLGGERCQEVCERRGGESLHSGELRRGG